MPVGSIEQRRDIQAVEDIIKEEINIKTIEFVTEETDIVRRSVKPNFKVIGKKFGKQTKDVANSIREINDAQMKELIQNEKLSITVNNTAMEIILEDVEIVNEDIEGWLVASERGITVALDTELDAVLINEGIAREFVNRIQNLRKDSGFEVTDRIEIEFKAEEKIASAVNTMSNYIKNETLAANISENSELANATEIEIEEVKLFVVIRKK